MTEYEHNLATLKDFTYLSDNWDDEGASAVNAELIDIVKAVIGILPIQPEIFPTPSGTIQIEYMTCENGNLNHLNIEFINSTQLHIFEMIKDLTPVTFNVYNWTSDFISKKVSSFYKYTNKHI